MPRGLLRDHATVMHGMKQVSNDIARDPILWHGKSSRKVDG
jgi:chromosomal replication initiation ATPase DnaA